MMRATTLLLLVCIAGMLSIADPLSGRQIFDEDVIVLKNGRRISGRFLVVNSEYVVIQKGNTQMTFPRSAVRAPDRTCLADARLAIGDGEYERAKNLCQKYLIWFPQDQESREILASAETVQQTEQTREANRQREEEAARAAQEEAERKAAEEAARIAEEARRGLPEPPTKAVAAPPGGPNDPEVDDIDPIIIEQNAKKIVGTYYFKGLRLMDIREDGEEAYTTLYRETEDIEVLTSGSMSPPFMIDKMSEHRGRLTDNRQLVFPEFPFTKDGLLKQMGLGPNPNPTIQAQIDANKQAIQAVVQHYSFDEQATYYERWRLVDNGRLQIESSVPIFISSSYQDILALQELIQRTMQGDLLKPGEHKRICGWKIIDPREKQAWGELEKPNYLLAAALFNAAAKAQPTSPFPLIGEALARTGARDFTRARAALDIAEARLNDETRPCLQSFITMIRDQVYSYESLAVGEDLLQFVDDLAKAPILQNFPFELKPAKELSADELQGIEALANAFKHWARVDTAVNETRGRGPTLPLDQRMTLISARANAEPLNATIVLRIGVFIILKGHLARQTKQDYAMAINDYWSAAALGQKFRHGSLAAHSTGLLLEQGGIFSMKEFIEDGLLNSQETLDVLSQRVDELLATEPSIANHEPTCYEEMIPAQMSAPLYELNGQGTLSLVLNRDFELSARLVHTNLTLLKAAAILKGKHLSGPYPDDFDVNLLPDDPFQPGSKIKYRAGEAEAVLYSVGPDGIDNQGQMVYNPENGIVSNGDIVLVVK